jgi:hypothetical protein
MKRLALLLTAAAAIQQYGLNFDTTPDYLNISHDVDPSTPEKYYYMTLGDFGGIGIGCDRFQVKVADAMRQYRQNRLPHKLLFVLNVGDSAYWSGVDSAYEKLRTQYRDVYYNLLDVPWFSVMGNHDWGNDDAEAACADLHPRLTCTDSNRKTCAGDIPYESGVQETSYAGNQLDVNKQGPTPNKRGQFPSFVMPDYAYFYSIPKLQFELVVVDTNADDINGLGGNGLSGGASKLLRACHNDRNRLVHWLSAIKDASLDLLHRRSLESQQHNIAITNHYPHNGLRDRFLGSGRWSSFSVLSVFGHTHSQSCYRQENRDCVEVLTGGSGGCCFHSNRCSDGGPNGFGVVNFRIKNGRTEHYVACLGRPECSSSFTS